MKGRHAHTDVFTKAISRGKYSETDMTVTSPPFILIVILLTRIDSTLLWLSQ